MNKGIDNKFVHYGIRREDLAMIEAICDADGIDFEWLSEEVLKAYHAKKVDVIEISDSDTEEIIRAAIQSNYSADISEAS
jgi:arsenate reductase-like glutaredoxin family protein